MIDNDIVSYSSRLRQQTTLPFTKEFSLEPWIRRTPLNVTPTVTYDIPGFEMRTYLRDDGCIRVVQIGRYDRDRWREIRGAWNTLVGCISL